VLSQTTNILAAIGAACALVTLVWRAMRKLTSFVEAVTRNTSAVAALGDDLRAHTITTTTALTALDARVTRLETTP
jgi:hypothetical protein